MKIVNESRLEDKKTNNNNIVMKILIIVGGILLVVGLFYRVPDRNFYFSDITEYVGGDAYNAIIEASIRSGEIAGAMVSKTIYICSGLIITIFGCLKLKNNNKSN